MMRISRAVLLSSLLFSAIAVASALPSNLRLLGLVPPDSQIVAGMARPAGGPDRLSSFLFLTEDNRLDLQDFFAVSGADTTRSILRIVFTAGAGPNDPNGPMANFRAHSLLVGGHFERDAIFRSATRSTARLESYRGLTVLAVPAFQRERSLMHTVRWLAIPDAKIAIFGTPGIVERELDRYLAGAPPAPMLVQRLSRLASNDDSWCLLPGSVVDGSLRRDLEDLDEKLGAAVEEGTALEYGMHYGRSIEITASSEPPAITDPAPPNESRVLAPASFGFLQNVSAHPNIAARKAVKLPRGRYEKWLVVFAARHPRISAVPHG